MNSGRRIALGLAILGMGWGAQAALEAAVRTPRPPLKRQLASLPMQLGSWRGRDEPINPRVLEKSQADDYVNRVYESSDRRGHTLRLWINYSRHGLNLRHSPEICLPSGGWSKLEAQTKTISVERTAGAPLAVMRLCYAQGDMVQSVGFWYYIFGEGAVEHLVRTLPITSRSSHGRTTRGSGLTVEVFSPGEIDPEGDALREFTRELLRALEPILPDGGAAYHIP